MISLKLSALLAATAIAITTPAIAAETSVEAKSSVKTSADGDIKQSSSKVIKDAAGTKTKTSLEAELDVNEDGDKKETIVKEESTDPKGLMNKTKVKTKETVEVKDG